MSTEQFEQSVRSACSELGRRLRSGEASCAEDYLAILPAVSDHSELALELIYTEYVVREELGQPAVADEWFARFPQWRDDLRQLLEVHRQVCDGDTIRNSQTTHKPTLPGGPSDGSPDQWYREQERFFGNYHLLEEIGRGGMGVVYRARQLNLNRDVALKMILSGEFASPRETVRFQTEAQAAARLHHPNIVQVFEVGAHDQRPYLSMELVIGTNLETKLKSGLPTPRDSAKLLETIARAVHHAHQQGVVHRDVSSRNSRALNQTQFHF